MVEFPTSGVETYFWLPTLVAFVLATITSSAGVTGAFLLLPFQMSVLGYTAPGVSATNLLYNIFAIPLGVNQYQREKRMVWSLAWLLGLATIPGILLGALIRVLWLPDPGPFKAFVGLVLLYLGARIAIDLWQSRRRTKMPGETKTEGVIVQSASFKEISYHYQGTLYRVPNVTLFVVCVLVGIVSGAYGIGGGAFLSPIMVSVYGLPVYTIAGAALFSTAVASVAGVLIYPLVMPYVAGAGVSTAPDLLLGLAFGIGGALGVWVGARVQRFLPQGLIKAIMMLSLLFIAVRYLWAYVM
jgi:hypothetical protein